MFITKKKKGRKMAYEEVMIFEFILLKKKERKIRYLEIKDKVLDAWID